MLEATSPRLVRLRADATSTRHLALPEIPGARVLVGVAHAQLGFVGLDVGDLSAKRDGLRLRLGVHIQIDTAADDVGDRGGDDNRAVAAHERRRLLSQDLSQRLAKRSVTHQQVGDAGCLADVEDGTPSATNAAMWYIARSGTSEAANGISDGV